MCSLYAKNESVRIGLLRAMIYTCVSVLVLMIISCFHSIQQKTLHSSTTSIELINEYAWQSLCISQASAKPSSKRTVSKKKKKRRKKKFKRNKTSKRKKKARRRGKKRRKKSRKKRRTLRNEPALRVVQLKRSFERSLKKKALELIKSGQVQ